MTRPKRATSEIVPKMVAENLTAGFGDKTVLRSISFPIEENRVTAIIGPSGCGKSTFIRCLNRMHELVPIARISGRIDVEDLLDVIFRDFCIGK